MSLINEALKKAQRQRTDEPAPVAPAPTSDTPAAPAAVPMPRIVKRRPPMPAGTLVLLLGGGGALVIMLGVFVVMFFFGGSEPSTPAKPAITTASPIASAPAPAPAPAPTTVVFKPEPAVISVQLPPVVAPPPAPIPVQVPAPAPVVTAPPVFKPAPVVVPPAPREPVANPAVYEFLEKLRVSGVRASATDPKVIMNDRVLRLNDIVDKSMQLRLLRIDSAYLVFSDPSGFEYRKNL